MNRQDLKTIIYAEKTKDETNKYTGIKFVCAVVQAVFHPALKK